MLTMEKQRTDLIDDIADYAKDGRLAGPSDGKRYEWKELIEAAELLGRPLTKQEMEKYRIH